MSIDWSKAGTRLRRSPERHGRNPDWNFRSQRWKTLEEYAGETLRFWEVQALVPCHEPGCGAICGQRCRDTRGNFMKDTVHHDRIVDAGRQMIANGWTLARLDD